MGILTASAMLDLAQFWPQGGSDADTVRLKLTGSAPFTFQADPAVPRKATAVFDGAFVRVKGRKENVITTKREIRVRLQGVDAPELHYSPERSSPELRQPWAETATVALAGHLQQRFGGSVLACEFVTHVDAPNEVCDMYARFIGDVVVTAGNAAFNVNEWLLAEGWALPSFYNSMSDEEIRRLTDLGSRARAASKGLWKRGAYSAAIGSLNTALTYRKPDSPVAPDRGRVILPKLFRRLYAWHLKRAAGKTSTASLREFLLEPKPSSRDKFFLAEEFLDQGPAAVQHDLGDAINPKHRLRHGPEAIIFKEGASTLFNAAGKKVTAW